MRFDRQRDEVFTVIFADRRPAPDGNHVGQLDVPRSDEGPRPRRRQYGPGALGGFLLPPGDVKPRSSVYTENRGKEENC